MFHRFASRSSVAIAGSILGLASLPFGWLTLKPNRLAAGVSLNLADSFGWGGAAIIIILWLVCLALALSGKEKRYALLLGIAANLTLVAAIGLAGFAASGLLKSEPPLTRVSLSSGLWLTVAAAFIVIFAARQGLTRSPLRQALITWSGLAAVTVLLATGWLNNISVLQEFLGQEERFQQELIQHFFLFGISIVVGVVLGVPLGLWAVQGRWAQKPIFFIANITQTIPSLALFGLMIAPLSALSLAYPLLREWGIRGIGAAPAIIALIIYSLLPIIQNTYVGFRQLDPAIIDAGLGMGMSRSRLFRRIEAPLAAPLVMEGIRTAAVQAVGNTAVAALIGAGGLGQFIFQGLGQAAPDLIILGALPIIIIALVVDLVMRIFVRLATPRGLRGSQ